MSNTDLTPTETRLALFVNDSPIDAVSNIGLLASFLADAIIIEDADHPGLTLIHGIIRDSATALSQRLSHAA